jgi:hypothetical protein
VKLFVFSLLLLAANLTQAQCSRNYFVLSPALGKAPGSSLSINLEAGLVPYMSKAYVSFKSSMWSEAKTVRYINSKGEEASIDVGRAAAFIGINYGYVPMAFEEVPRKWVFGAAAGALLRKGEQSRPAAQLSAAYTVRMAAGNYTSGLGCLKLEGTCLISALGVKPGISAGVFLLL